MRYNDRLRKITQVGGLHLKYNRRGRLIRQIGSVKPIVNCTFCGVNSCAIDHRNVHINDDFNNVHTYIHTYIHTHIHPYTYS